MPDGGTNYPIARFVQRLIDESGLRRSEFVARIGYPNAAKGLRRLDALLQYGEVNEVLLQRIVNAFQPDPGELETALSETEEMHQREHAEAVLEAEERLRRRFRSFIWVHSEDGAHSLFSAMGERHVKTLWFQADFERLSKAEQLKAVQRRVRGHYQQTGGKYPGFGAILRYQWADSVDTSVVLDITGNVIEESGGRFLLPEVWMELHG
jgi:hypothetical protein